MAGGVAGTSRQKPRKALTECSEVTLKMERSAAAWTHPQGTFALTLLCHTYPNRHQNKLQAHTLSQARKRTCATATSAARQRRLAEAPPPLPCPAAP